MGSRDTVCESCGSKSQVLYHCKRCDMRVCEGKGCICYDERGVWGKHVIEIGADKGKK